MSGIGSLTFWSLLELYHRRERHGLRAKHIPDHLQDGEIRVPPGVFAEEAHRFAGVADERAQEPAHLDTDEGEENQPDAQQDSVAGITGNKGSVEAAQEMLGSKAGNAEHERIEENRA